MQPRNLLGVMAMFMMAFAGFACSRSGQAADAPDPQADRSAPSGEEEGRLRAAVLAGGCFWCTEAVFEPMEGVVEVDPVYAGGTKETANYEAVASGQTEHAEAIRITYDPEKVTYMQLLKVFFDTAHDPTQLNRQGPDRGPQYRSAIFYENEEQKRVAEAYIRQLEEAKVFEQPIVTTLEPLEAYYPAEQYHQDYVERNPNQPYVRAQALPKLEKLRRKHGDKLKSETAAPKDHE